VGDVLNVSIPVADPSDRTLTFIWTLDDAPLDEDTGSLNLVLGGGPWAREGIHSLKALVLNPDGVELDVNMTYAIEYSETADDDVSTDDDDISIPAVIEEENDGLGQLGVVIIIAGIIAVIIQFGFMVYSIAGPLEKKTKIRESKAEAIEIEELNWDDKEDYGYESGGEYRW
jgi:hypothetical protein